MAKKKNPLNKEIYIKKKELQYPSKTSINLVGNKEEKKRKQITLSSVIFLVGLVIFTEVAVLRPMRKISEAEKAYQREENILTQLKENNKDFNEVKKTFDEVSAWYLDDDEKKDFDKYEALLMIKEDILPYADVESVSMAGNSISVQTGELSLAEVSDMLLKLQQDKRNAFVSIQTTGAAGGASNDSVVASITIQYQNTLKEDNGDA